MKFFVAFVSLMAAAAASGFHSMDHPTVNPAHAAALRSAVHSNLSSGASWEQLAVVRAAAAEASAPGISAAVTKALWKAAEIAEANGASHAHVAAMKAAAARGYYPFTSKDPSEAMAAARRAAPNAESAAVRALAEIATSANPADTEAAQAASREASAAGISPQTVAAIRAAAAEAAAVGVHAAEFAALNALHIQARNAGVPESQLSAIHSAARSSAEKLADASKFAGPAATMALKSSAAFAGSVEHGTTRFVGTMDNTQHRAGFAHGAAPGAGFGAPATGYGYAPASHAAGYVAATGAHHGPGYEY